ncbi:MAG: transcriptional repressor NrdR [Chloroflexi bacterium]|nr:transcriptional repressor NrdR [Chloroflexota bacterium]
MHCPNCGDPNTRVTDSRDTGQDIRRRRECGRCGVRFTTYERIQHATLQVIKRDGRRDEFDPQKLLRSIRLACTKRPLPTGAIEKLTSEIENDLQDLGKAEVPASVIGDLALERLRQLDPVAYVRYASVYRDFDTLDGFIQEIREYQATGGLTSEQEVSQLSLIPNEFAVPTKRTGRRGRRPSMTQPLHGSAAGAS